MRVTTCQLRRTGAVLAATGALGLLCGPAAADVSVASGDVTAGSTGFVGLAVSTERLDAATNRVELRLPIDRTFATVAAGAKPGWDVSLARVGTEAISAITWTAQTDAYAIRPGNFEMFSVKLGPMPADVDQFALSAVQSYTDGQTAPSTVMVAVLQDPAMVPAAAVAEAAAAPAVEEPDNAARVAAGLAVGVVFLLLGVLVAAAVNRRGRQPDPV